MPGTYRNRTYGIASLNQNKSSSGKPLRYSVDVNSSEGKYGLTGHDPGSHLGAMAASRGNEPMPKVYHMTVVCLAKITEGHPKAKEAREINSQYIKDMLKSGAIESQEAKERATRTIENLECEQ